MEEACTAPEEVSEHDEKLVAVRLQPGLRATPDGHD
jgi:hypothetical protein